jgi:hypothetical protein
MASIYQVYRVDEETNSLQPTDRFLHPGESDDYLEYANRRCDADEPRVVVKPVDLTLSGGYLTSQRQHLGGVNVGGLLSVAKNGLGSIAAVLLLC